MSPRETIMSSCLHSLFKLLSVASSKLLFSECEMLRTRIHFAGINMNTAYTVCQIFKMKSFELKALLLVAHTKGIRARMSTEGWEKKLNLQ